MAINSEDCIIQLSALTGRSRLGGGILFGTARTSGGDIIVYKWTTGNIFQKAYFSASAHRK